MTDSKAQVLPGRNKAETETTLTAGGLSSPPLNLRRESSASIRNFFRSLSRSEDGGLVQSKTPVATVEASSQPSGGAVERTTVPFELDEPAVTDPPIPYDLDIVAVHGYGDDLRSAWVARVRKPANPVEPGMSLTRDEASKKQTHTSAQEPPNLKHSDVIPPLPQLEPTPEPTMSMIAQQSAQIAIDEGAAKPADEKKAKLEQTVAWVRSTTQELRGSPPEYSHPGGVENADHQTVKWLRDSQFLPGKFRRARVLLFQYCEPVDDGKPPLLQGVIQELAKRLEAARKDDPERPIIFLGHDFGITVVESTLIDLWKAEGAGRGICKATAGIAFFMSELSPSTTDDSRYFDTAVHVRLGPDHEKLPYQETKNDHFLVHHIDNFREFTRSMAQMGPEITLKCFMSNGKIAAENDPAYCGFLKLIASTREVYGLLVAAAAGDAQRVKVYLENGRKPDLQNSSGQTALHLAVQHGRRNVVRLLTKTYQVDVSLCDATGQTALHLAIMHCGERQDIIEMLLQRGADVNAKNKFGKSPLDLAEAYQVDPVVLKSRPLVEGPSEDAILERLMDPIPPKLPSAIHACHSFHATLADFFLIDRKEKFIYEQPTVFEVLYETGPEEILEAIRGPSVTEPPRCRWVHLPSNNVAWVDDLLLKMKITTDPLTADQHEGPTAWSHFMRPQARITKPVKHVQATGGRWTITEYPGSSYMLLMPYLNYEAACDQYALSSVIREPPSKELVLFAAIEVLDKSLPNMLPKLDTTIKQRGRHLSLPETAQQSPQSSVPSPHPSASGELRSEPLATSAMSTSARPPENLEGYSVQDDESRALMGSTLPMDYSNRLRKEEELIRGYLYTSRPISNSSQQSIIPGPLHIRRTLDQSHYFMLTDTAYRDRHQIVLKEARKQASIPQVPATAVDTTVPFAAKDDQDEERVQHDSEEYPLVMVDQLWLWVIGNTVITCFPQSWTRKDGKREGDVLDHLLHYLRTEKRRPLIREPQDLVDVVISYCAGVFNRPRSAHGLGLHDHFEISVGRAAESETQLFRRFEEDSAKDPTTLMKTTEGKMQLERLFNIVPEVKLLDKTKDNVDELRMILRILGDQALVMTDMAFILQKGSQSTENQLTHSPQKLDADRSPHKITTTFTEGAAEGPTRTETISMASRNRHPIIDANIRDFDRMLSHANASYEALNHLLDLKQKHATVTEARFAGNRADETARQGNTIMFFTIVTIIFGSASFVTAFFALNVTMFPKDKNGATIWSVIGVALPFVLIAFMINPIKEFSDKRRRAGYKSRVVHWICLLASTFWQTSKARLKRQSGTTLHKTDQEEKESSSSSLADAGQQFGDGTIDEAKTDDPALASVNSASHKVTFSVMTRSRRGSLH
ncbi:hypothetical protein PV04_06467 [Phialophora macrospora]|uniref:Uncharacterized protein n=1 Tax=Phialophora macrospora TaxID=1851006 RepID=A0A0D2FKB8_9EURO|nr:hypothetical protein PV04_06467 [Phialophora macrospora]